MISSIRGRVGQPLTIAGYANDFDKRIKAVQFSLDDGQTWTTFDTPDTVPDKNLYWKFEYLPEIPGMYQLLVRSINEDDVPSPTPAVIDFMVE